MNATKRWDERSAKVLFDSGEATVAVAPPPCRQNSSLYASSKASPYRILKESLVPAILGRILADRPSSFNSNHTVGQTVKTLDHFISTYLAGRLPSLSRLLTSLGRPRLASSCPSYPSRHHDPAGRIDCDTLCPRLLPVDDDSWAGGIHVGAAISKFYHQDETTFIFSTSSVDLRLVYGCYGSSSGCSKRIHNERSPGLK